MADFKRTYSLDSIEILHESQKSPHSPHELPRGKCAVYVFSLSALHGQFCKAGSNKVLKVGKAAAQKQRSFPVITYRFSQPDEPAAIVVPQFHRLSNRNQPPEELKNFADHLLRRRLSLKLLQRQVAEQLGVDKASIYNWENNRAKPDIEYMPAIIRFLGYNPLPQAAKGWADRLVQGRTTLGLTQKEAAREMCVDPSTLARWERGEREPEGAFAARALYFLSAAKAPDLPLIGDDPTA